VPPLMSGTLISVPARSTRRGTACAVGGNHVPAERAVFHVIHGQVSRVLRQSGHRQQHLAAIARANTAALTRRPRRGWKLTVVCAVVASTGSENITALAEAGPPPWRSPGRSDRVTGDIEVASALSRN
jgi:hypothetical protein